VKPMREDLRIVEPDAEEGALCAVLDESGMIHRVRGRFIDLWAKAFGDYSAYGQTIAETHGEGAYVLTEFSHVLFPENLARGEDWFETCGYYAEPPEWTLLHNEENQEKISYRIFYQAWASTLKEAYEAHRRACRVMRQMERDC